MSLKKEISSLKDGQSMLIITKKENYFEKISEILSTMTKVEKKDGIYISISKPYSKILKNLKGFEKDKVLFLDAISRVLNENIKTDNCVQLQGPTSLTELGICITKAALNGRLGFLILDSLSGVLNYNSEKTTIRFLQYLISKIKSYELAGIIFIETEDESKPAIKIIGDLVDKTLKT